MKKDENNGSMNLSGEQRGPSSQSLAEAEVETYAGERSWSFLGELRIWLKDLCLAALIALVLVVFVVQPVRVEGNSMVPLLEPQDRIFVNKFVYHFSEIERGDIVVFWYPKDLTKSFIKRVIALPGDQVEIRSGVVYLNGRRVRESYLPEGVTRRSYPSQIVPAGYYFVLGDHRITSSDSRHWGNVPEQNIFGKAVFRYWPLWRLGLID